MFTEPVQTRDYKKKLLHRYYYIDIETALLGKEHYESAIISVDTDRTVRENFGRDLKLDLSTPEKEYENFYFPCNQLLNSDEWEEGLLAYDVTKFGRYAQFRKQVVNEFRNYNIPIIELSKENKKEAVCLVFEKVNTGGVPLSVFELMTATYAIDNVNLRDEWFGNAHEGIEGTQPHLRKQSLLREVQPTEFLQGLTLLHTPNPPYLSIGVNSHLSVNQFWILDFRLERVGEKNQHLTPRLQVVNPQSKIQNPKSKI